MAFWIGEDCEAQREKAFDFWIMEMTGNVLQHSHCILLLVLLLLKDKTREDGKKKKNCFSWDYLLLICVCVCVCVCVRYMINSNYICKLTFKNIRTICILGFPGGSDGKESTCQWRRHKRRWFDPWVRKIPWRRA